MNSQKCKNEEIHVLNNMEGIFFDENLKMIIFKKYKIVSKNVGIDKSTKTMKQFCIEPFLLDKYSVAFLMQKQPQHFNINPLNKDLNLMIKEIQLSLQFRLFCCLKQKYFLINGHKFGSQFLAYEQDPQKSHAKFLVFLGQEKDKEQKFNHMTRLAQIGKKRCLFFYQDHQNKLIQLELQRKKSEVSNKRSNKINKILDKIDQKHINQKK